tara:strand:+ start:265 stop:825 length:561 start_codon:yes stop_codon:yes gene_type:complete
MSNKSISIFIEKATDKLMEEILLAILKWFNRMGYGNPFNYNRGIEFLQARMFGFKLTIVGGGSDGKNDEGITAEFKYTKWIGYTKKGTLRSHPFTYNGTTRKNTLEEQEKYCREKIMRDPHHYWSLIDNDTGKFVHSYKVPAETVWKLLWPKWKRSFHNPNAADPRIGAQLTTNDLNGEEFEFILH